LNQESKKLFSLKDAARLYTEKSYDKSAMQQIILYYIHHKAMTKMLLKEVEKVMDDL
jgi:hypothetical protein